MIIAYQLIIINNLEISYIIELVKSKYNTDNKAISILTNKNLLQFIGPLIIIILFALFLLRNKLKKLIIDNFIINKYIENKNQ